MPILIDGYNLLRAVQKMQEQPDLVDADMCAVICEYLRRMGDIGTIVFDGIGPPNKERLMGLHHLQVIFSGRNIEADAIIEQHIHDNTAPKRLIVVSSDRRIRTAAKRRKCIDVPAGDFWMQVCHTVEKQLPVPEPRGKRQGISDSETQQWLKVFGLTPGNTDNTGQAPKNKK
jgi:predicted RNA-binding protein with PIN domain